MTNGGNINFIFTIYTQAVLFPIRGVPAVIGSSVIAASIEGLSNGLTLMDSVIITLALTINDVSVCICV